MQILGGLLVTLLLGGVLVGSFVGSRAYFSAQQSGVEARQAEIAELLAGITEELNRETPRTIGTGIAIRRYRGADSTLVVDIFVSDRPGAETAAAQLVDRLAIAGREDYCQLPETRVLRDNGLAMRYLFQAPGNKELADITFHPADCITTNLIPR